MHWHPDWGVYWGLSSGGGGNIQVWFGRDPVGEGYSDLVWTGVCRLNLKPSTHLEGSFWQKRVPIVKDFS